MEHQKNRTNRPRFVRKEREPGFHGYFAEVRDGEDPMRAYRRIKKKQKDDNFFEVLKEKQYFRKPSFIKREKEKKRKQTIRRASRENASWHQIPKQRGHQ
tara:strand:- start:57 stop:356 length:300 start_codon:yes stop_codon:yes gene_type:complete